MLWVKKRKGDGIMKKLAIILLALLLVLPAAVHADEMMAGGWTPAEDYTVTEERQAVFEKGLEQLVGVDYVPAAYLGSQVVAGTNHVFLCKATVVYPDAKPTYVLVYLYEDLQGGVTLMNVADLGIVPQEDGAVTVPEAGLMGGWYYAEAPEITEEIQARLDKALEGLVGAAYVAVANLGEQVVAGRNRCLLCQVTPVVPDAQPHYALVYVYEKLDGGAELSRVIDLDIGAYCTYGA